MASASLFSLSLCFLVLFHGCSAQIEQVPFGTRRQEQQQRFQSECRLDNLNVKEPYQRIESEAGVSEYWDQNDPQFQCAGVALVRHQIQRRGLLLPSFSNAPELIYVVQGRGLHGAVIPGCPETFQSDSSRQQTSRRGERPQPRSRDQHQKVRRIRQGDVIALPAGVAHWIYNDGDAQLVLVNFFDTSNPANQLDETARKFFLAGNPQQQGGSQRRGPSSPRGGSQQNSNNLFNGFDEEFLADSLNVDNDLARKLQCRDDQRGKIVRAKDDLQVLGPQWEEDERERERERESEKRSWEKKWGRGESLNGIEETFCTLRLKHNIEDPRRADVFNPHGGRISSLNSLNLPILRYLQLSAERGVLYREAMMTPHYNLNSHSIIYVIKGNARVQVVGDNGDNVFDGQLQQGQVLTVPQNFAVIKKAGKEGFEWVSFKTNDNAKINPLAGRLSAIRAIPEDVLINAYRMEREEARRLKFNRRESTLLSSESLQRGRG